MLARVIVAVFRVDLREVIHDFSPADVKFPLLELLSIMNGFFGIRLCELSAFALRLNQFSHSLTFAFSKHRVSCSPALQPLRISTCLIKVSISWAATKPRKQHHCNLFHVYPQFDHSRINRADRHHAQTRNLFEEIAIRVRIRHRRGEVTMGRPGREYPKWDTRSLSQKFTPQRTSGECSNAPSPTLQNEFHGADTTTVSTVDYSYITAPTTTNSIAKYNLRRDEIMDFGIKERTTGLRVCETSNNEKKLRLRNRKPDAAMVEVFANRH